MESTTLVFVGFLYDEALNINTTTTFQEKGRHDVTEWSVEEEGTRKKEYGSENWQSRYDQPNLILKMRVTCRN